MKAADATFVQAFMSTCVRDFDNRERIEAASKAMDWKLITDPSMRKMLEPENGSANWAGWAFPHDNLKLMLALSESKIEDHNVKTCVLISELTSIKATKARLVQLLDAKSEGTDSEGGQTSEVLRFTFDGKPRLLSFIDAEAMGMKMLNASVSSDWTAAK
jgi:hypothetical protein